MGRMILTFGNKTRFGTRLFMNLRKGTLIMRSWLLAIWLMLPAVVGAYHFGPGQNGMKMDKAADALAQAKAAVSAENWSVALSAYDAALGAVDAKTQPELAYSIRLGKAQAQMFASQLPEASSELEMLLEDMNSDPKSDAKIKMETLSTLANAKFYMTWLKRLEGLGEPEWQPDVENARQTYRQLAEDAEKTGDLAAAKTYRDDLEGTIRLARMDVSELQGMPIPKPCSNCKSGQCKSKAKGRKPNPKKDGRGAGAGPAPDGSGS